MGVAGVSALSGKHQPLPPNSRRVFLMTEPWGVSTPGGQPTRAIGPPAMRMNSEDPSSHRDHKEIVSLLNGDHP